jgi:hypothetical protein
MHASCFDRLTRLLARRTSRRRAGQVLGSLAAAGALSVSLDPNPASATIRSVAKCPTASTFGAYGPQDGGALTFSPNRSGRLRRMTVIVEHSPTPAVGYFIQLLGTDSAGTPVISRVMAKKEIPFEALANTGSVPLTVRFRKGKGPTIGKGKTYAILVTRNSDGVGTTLDGIAGNPCSDGRMFFFTASNGTFLPWGDDDAIFEVFVES